MYTCQSAVTSTPTPPASPERPSASAEASRCRAGLAMAGRLYPPSCPLVPRSGRRASRGRSCKVNYKSCVLGKEDLSLETDFDR
jgi:hypothetical protein